MIRHRCELRKFVAPEFIFGTGALSLAGQYARNFNSKRVLIVSDPGVMAAGWTQKVAGSIEAQNIEFFYFSEISSNPRLEEVMHGARVYRENKCDTIIAVGGGSPIDCAKGIGIISSNGKHILDYVGVDKISKPMPPLICVPTTAGAAADISQFAVITDKNEKTEKTIVSKTVVPDVSLIDPETTTTLSPYLTALTGIDCLVHAIEAFVSNAHSDITDIHAIEAIKLITKYFLSSVLEPKNLEYRTQMMLASLQAGLAFSNTSLGITHALAHSLGGLSDLHHGQCNAILLEHVLDYNFSETPGRYETIGEAMNLNFRGLNQSQKKKSLIKEIKRLKKEAQIDDSLQLKGISSSDIAALADNAMQDICILTNPRKPSKKDLELIYEEAL